MGTQQLEEVALGRDAKIWEPTALQFGYQFVPLLGTAVGEGCSAAPVRDQVQSRQPDPVGLGPVPVGAREGPIHVSEDPDLGRAGPVLVDREETFEERRTRPRLIRIQNQQCRCLFLHTPSRSPELYRGTRDGALPACRNRRSASTRSSCAGIARTRTEIGRASCRERV